MDKNSPKYKEVRNKSISLQKDIYDFDKKFLSGDTKDLQNTIDFIIDRYSVKSDCNYSCADYYATFEVDECKSTLYRNKLELCYITLGKLLGKLYMLDSIKPIE